MTQAETTLCPKCHAPLLGDPRFPTMQLCSYNCMVGDATEEATEGPVEIIPHDEWMEGYKVGTFMALHKIRTQLLKELTYPITLTRIINLLDNMDLS